MKKTPMLVSASLVLTLVLECSAFIGSAQAAIHHKLGRHASFHHFASRHISRVHQQVTQQESNGATSSYGLSDLIARHANENGVPVSLAKAVVHIESSYNPRAVHAGNFGLMQIRYNTARTMGFSGSASSLLDPDTNLHYGVKYLAQVYRMAGGDTCRSLMYYQMGPGARHASGASRAYCRKAKDLIARG